MEIDLDGDRIEDVRVLSGCDGNLQGIIRLVKGQDAGEVIRRLQGIQCGGKATSCPDQLARGLRAALEEEKRGK